MYVNPKYHFTEIRLEPYELLGVGSYGNVVKSGCGRTALKRFADKNYFRWELAISLILISETHVGFGTHVRDNFLKPLAFSAKEQTIAFELMSMDLKTYVTTDSIHFTDFTWMLFVKNYLCLESAIKFMNFSCGIAHLDIKLENILVNIDPVTNMPLRFVIADFSVAGFNASSPFSACNISCPSRSSVCGFELIGKTELLLNRPNTTFIVGHGHMQPPEILLAYINGYSFNRHILDIVESFSIDIYALGQTLLEVILLRAVNVELALPISRIPSDSACDPICKKYALKVLAYRIVLEKNLAVVVPHAPPIPDRMKDITDALNKSKYRRMLKYYVDIYSKSLYPKPVTLELSDHVLNAFVLFSRFCRWEPGQRSEL
ncbi:tegument serine/threonine protein kinase [Psittacid alphaherpesvirus 5]|uniref:Tegument serine/threonine protein kinase n=1 Tax=Psittacid alphaherpesvirus 5 TaxID=2972693 RepID=A0A5P9JSR3_9ALPH|nr:tegument serine/threonine protein kinase [Psittacid alphaherpesvirus 5]QFU14590.1 tegument serine/threonine protein kinase [Psittacid alphaherpesvirus 5]UOO01061.1 tegument serine/threonine protein kinase [Psittacid alphaherpesvirus 5]